MQTKKTAISRSVFEGRRRQVLRLPAKSNPAEFFYMQKALKYRACMPAKSNPRGTLLQAKSSKVPCLPAKSSPAELAGHIHGCHGCHGWPRLAAESTHQVLLRAPFLHAPGARMTVVELTPSKY